ncbi:dephospho-CoA kinase [Anaerosacchariphilus polymeriproducens]|uniref:Dephospho-CoA kinase n=1 Tax=Anaerosacchariphilus polymeriproducens TaxID=1812858 RepID=A0A371ATJ7_9FIRM|nr:dephospho-CoA kinase [Anaerosacchariphilus polymeriproducens]RDU22893.1 dephospho-CoA kinase [Anaerosacchariphilus polymeriproducens]
MKVIGITGGVGAGKSFILDYLKNNYGAKLLIADEIGHQVMKKGTTGYEMILKAFTSKILDNQGEISRPILAEIIFSDLEKREILNKIIHPLVKSYIQAEIENFRKIEEIKLVVVEAALLIEDHYETICDEFWYIYTKNEIRKQRLKLSRGYSEEKIEAIFASQASEEMFRKNCSVVIDNNLMPNEVYHQIDLIMKNREES